MATTPTKYQACMIVSLAVNRCEPVRTLMESIVEGDVPVPTVDDSASCQQSAALLRALADAMDPPA